MIGCIVTKLTQLLVGRGAILIRGADCPMYCIYYGYLFTHVTQHFILFPHCDRISSVLAIHGTYSVLCNWRSQCSHSSYAPQELALLSGPTPNWGSVRAVKGSNCEDSIQDNKSLGEESTKLLMHMQHQMEIKNFCNCNGELERANVAIENSGGRKKDRKWKPEQGNKVK